MDYGKRLKELEARFDKIASMGLGRNEAKERLYFEIAVDAVIALQRIADVVKGLGGECVR